MCADDAEIRVRRQAVHRAVQQREKKQRRAGHAEKQCEVLDAEQLHDLPDHRLGEGEVQRRRTKRQQEDEQHLCVHALADIALSHADALHDGKAGGVLVPLDDLLVVEHQQRCKEKQHAQKNAEEEETAVEREKLCADLRDIIGMPLILDGEGADRVLRAEVKKFCYMLLVAFQYLLLLVLLFLK